jgi:DICT domain-containing protein
VNLYAPGLTIGELAERTGVTTTTLRSWELRHGFPTPDRLPGGHRRYRPGDVAIIEAVTRARREGVPLADALERARRRVQAPRASILAAVRSMLPDIPPVVLSKATMYDVSRAIEDAAAAHTGSVVIGAFQEPRFWDPAGERWQRLAASADVAVALAAFPGTERQGRVWRVGLDPATPVAREWAVVVDGEAFGACLVGVERTDPGRRTDRRRRFEAVWTVEPAVVREAARAGAAIAAARAPDLGRILGARLAPPPCATEASLRLATTVTNRILHHVERRRRN